MLIKWKNLIFNQQLKHLDLSLSFYYVVPFCLYFIALVMRALFLFSAYFKFKL